MEDVNKPVVAGKCELVEETQLDSRAWLPEFMVASDAGCWTSLTRRSYSNPQVVVILIRCWAETLALLGGRSWDCAEVRAVFSFSATSPRAEELKRSAAGGLMWMLPTTTHSSLREAPTGATMLFINKVSRSLGTGPSLILGAKDFYLPNESSGEWKWCSLAKWLPEEVAKLEVQSPPGTPIGYVIQNWHACLPKYTVQNEKKEDVLKIVGPCCTFKFCSDVNFEILSMDESAAVGCISKQWTGFVREAFTDADNFGIKFPLDLDVKMKAVLLGACFLIDFMFFENQQNRR
ncbi:uncharacterized protein LOC132891480 isoform X1 [Neoarius graeffei]|uniref:uncharacterized protein LOC132891480 isoform X1 n=1 Tax=Neoarius graeffei TaxID=443677 RepID=UPI00298D1AFA|nr:uncharacterized protein LOC132891480 isoform X1 [Neoarius graeffei]